MKDFIDRYPDDYFTARKKNYPERLASFAQEKVFLQKYTDLSGTVCDVGCSTGEFLSTIEWRGPKYGMEINPSAIEEAKNTGIRFDKNILTENGFFDAVIFRGTVQHIPEPFSYIGKAHDALRPGGVIVFLATPNANSLVYKLFNTLPALNPELNFYIPSDVSLGDILKNYDFRIAAIEFPYLQSPYAEPVADHLEFIKAVLLRRTPKFPFWRNMMNVVAYKI